MITKCGQILFITLCLNIFYFRSLLDTSPDFYIMPEYWKGEWETFLPWEDAKLKVAKIAICFSYTVQNCGVVCSPAWVAMGSSRCCSSQYRICVWQTSHASLTTSWGKSWAFVLLPHDDQPEQRFTFLRGRNELFMLIKALISREWKSNPYFDSFLYWNIFQCYADIFVWWSTEKSGSFLGFLSAPESQREQSPWFFLFSPCAQQSKCQKWSSNFLSFMCLQCSFKRQLCTSSFRYLEQMRIVLKIWIQVCVCVGGADRTQLNGNRKIMSLSLWKLSLWIFIWHILMWPLGAPSLKQEKRA